MDSSAFHLLLIPVCQGVCFGLIAGTVIRLVLGWLTARVDRLLSVREGSSSAQEWRQPKGSPKIGDSRVNWKKAF